MKYLLFDLDLTLVDSSIAETARDGRNWPLVYNLIPRFHLYDGMEEVFSYIREHGLKVAIVSSAPSVYINKVVRQFNIPVDVVIGYHDAARKPSPDGFLKALERLGGNREEAISFGDRAIDIQASHAAGIPAVACLWGTRERQDFQLTNTDYTALRAESIICILEGGNK